MKKVLALFFVLLFAVSQNGCSSHVPHTSGQDMLDAISRPNMNAIEQYVDNWYLFHDDRIYAYLFDQYGKGEDTFLSTDLNGNDVRIISQSDDLRYAELYFIYAGCAYYYTTFHQGVKKINIETGEISDVVNGKYLYLIPETLKDGKVIAEYENNYLNEAHVYIAALDLASGTLSNEKVLPFFGSTSYYYSAENNKIYFVGSDSVGNSCLYEDNTVIYTYPSGVVENDFVFTQDHYIFLVTSGKIIKLDMVTHAIVEENNFTNNGLRLFTSIRTRNHEFKKSELTAPVCVLENPLFSSKNNTVYQFDAQSIEFTETANIDKTNYKFIQKSGQRLILTGPESTAIYDESTGEASSFTSCNFGTDDKSIYLMTFDGDFYQFDQTCSFKVEKIRQGSDHW